MISSGAGFLKFLASHAIPYQRIPHPAVNTATLVLAKQDLTRFFELTGHIPQVIDIAPAG